MIVDRLIMFFVKLLFIQYTTYIILGYVFNNLIYAIYFNCALTLFITTKSILTNMNYIKRHFFYLLKFIDENRLFFFLIFTVFISTFIQGFFIKPNSVDSLSYHLPRILHWLEHENLMNFYSNNSREIYSPFAPIIFISPLLYFGITESFAFLVSWVPFVLIFCILYENLKILNVKIATIKKSLLLYLSLPVVLGLSSHVSTDLYSAFLFFAFYHKMTILNRFRIDLDLRGITYLITLVLTAKLSSGFLSLPLFVWFIYLIFFKKREFKIRKFDLLIFLLALILISISTYHDLYMNDFIKYISFISSFGFLNIAINGLRLLLTLAQTPFKQINDVIDSIFYPRNFLNSNSINPPTFGDIPWALSNSIHAEFAGAPLHLLLLLISILMIISNGTKVSLSIFLIWFSSFWLVACSLTWQPWANRFLVPFLLMSLIVISVSLEYSIRNSFVNILVVLISTYSIFWIFWNPGRTLFNPKILIEVGEVLKVDKSLLEEARQDVTLSEFDQFTRTRPEYKDLLISLSQRYSELENSKIGLSLGGDDLEFPIYRIFFGKGNKVNHLNYNLLENKDSKIIVCTFSCNWPGYNLVYQKSNFRVFEIKD